MFFFSWLCVVCNRCKHSLFPLFINSRDFLRTSLCSCVRACFVALFLYSWVFWFVGLPLHTVHTVICNFIFVAVYVLVIFRCYALVCLESNSTFELYKDLQFSPEPTELYVFVLIPLSYTFSSHYCPLHAQKFTWKVRDVLYKWDFSMLSENYSITPNFYTFSPTLSISDSKRSSISWFSDTLLLFL
jgi:hypothetical protein